MLDISQFSAAAVSVPRVLLAMLFGGIAVSATAGELTPQQLAIVGNKIAHDFKAPGRAKTRNLTTKERKIIASVVTHDFKDPDTARFRWLSVGEPMPDHPVLFYYCASVNGRNSYGAYTGYVPFLVSVHPMKNRIVGAYTPAVASDDIPAQKILWMCSKAGAALPQ